VTRNVVFGVLVEVKDFASAAFSKIQTAGQATDKGLGAAGKSISASMTGARHAVAFLDHGMRLLERGAGLLNHTIGDSIRKSLEFRAAGDAQAKSMHDFERAIEVTQARIGDKFIPVILGVEDSLKPVLKDFNTWMKTNDALIKSTLINWLAQGAHLLTDGIAGGVNLVIDGWYGWKLVIASTQAIANEAFSAILDGIGDVVGGLERFASFAGMDKFAGKLAGWKAGISDFGAQAKQIAEENEAQIYKEIRARDEAKKTVEQYREIVEKAIDGVAVNAHKHENDAIKATNKTLEERNKAAEIRKKLEEIEANHNMLQTQNYIKNWREAFERKNELLEHDAEAWDAKLAEVGAGVKKQLEETKAASEAMSGEIYGYLSAAAGAGVEAAKGAKDAWGVTTAFIGGALKQVGQMLLAQTAEMAIKYVLAKGIEKVTAKTTALGEIQAAAAVASANAFASYAGVPVFGEALGVAAGAAAYAQTMATAGLIGFHDGGVVPLAGGVRGRDSVPIMAEPGEGIVPVDMMRQLAKLFGMTEPKPAYASGGVVSALSGSAAMTVVYSPRTLTFASRADNEKHLRDNFLPVFSDMLRNGRRK
jgi:hypothetical protein